MPPTYSRTLQYNPTLLSWLVCNLSRSLPRTQYFHSHLVKRGGNWWDSVSKRIFRRGCARTRRRRELQRGSLKVKWRNRRAKVKHFPILYRARSIANSTEREIAFTGHSAMWVVGRKWLYIYTGDWVRWRKQVGVRVLLLQHDEDDKEGRIIRINMYSDKNEEECRIWLGLC